MHATAVYALLPADPSDDPCKDAVGPLRQACDQDGGGGGGGGASPPESLDPLMALAKQTARAADWTAGRLGDLISDRAGVDFTNQGFLKQYAIVFAASTVLTVILWLLAVVKRAVRGVPLSTAFGEAISLLWLAVAASAFTPLVLYSVIGATSAVTEAVVDAVGGDPGGTFTQLGSDLQAGRVGGGPLMLLVVSAATIALCGALWLLLVMRAMALYVGALFGVVIYSGLVDKDLWGRVRRWAGIMISLIAVEPVIAITVGLAAALETSGDTSAVVLGLGITVIALGISVYIIARAPGMGDAVRVARETARTAGIGGRAAAGAASTAQGVMSGISTHGSRPGAVNGTRVPEHRRNTGPAEGMSAHGSRKPPPKKDDPES
ncbi:hypothetical protein [Streptomyces violaceusniger]|uniref:hypothetical protein n=1 Tax=Streptomyces violaceusniger TaxID=68280 RepID=UPI0038194BB3